MYKILQITKDPLQRFNLILLDGSALQMEIYYRPMQYGWFINSLVYAAATANYGAPSNYSGQFTIQGMRITNSPNMLHQYRNQISFGLACYTNGGREPTQQEDFESGASSLYILTSEEVAQYAELLSNG
jgi:hypothetical protein